MMFKSMYLSKRAHLRHVKDLMAGKTGLNISCRTWQGAFAVGMIQSRMDLAPWIREWGGCHMVQAWMKSLGIESYVGTSELFSD
jgi:hypothetical protein